MRVADVATAAGTSIGAIYNHFRDRDALIAEARATQIPGPGKEDIAALRALVEADLDAHQLVSSLLDLVIRPHDDDRRQYRWRRIAAFAASRHNSTLAAEATLVQRELNELLLTVVDRAKELGIVDTTVDSRAAVLLVQAVALGLAIADVDPHTAPDDAAWLDLVERIGVALAPGLDRSTFA